VVKRTVVGAHYGIMGWLVQRISAAIMALLILLFLAVLLDHHPLSYDIWKTLLSQLWLRIGMQLFLIGLFLHAWVGMRDILMDYVHATGIRLLLQVLVLVALSVYAIWSIRVIWEN